MTKKELEQIKKWSKTELAKLVTQFFQERIDNLNKISNIDEKEDIEIEIKARRRAIAILNLILKDLSLLRQEEDFKRDKDEYE